MLKPLVYQIAFGEIPEEIQKCLDSVKAWADKMGYDYQCDTEVPSKYEGRPYRITSEWIRIEKLAERPYLCYVDWDIMILKDIVLEENILTINTIDTFLYLGNNIEIAQKVLERANNTYSNRDKTGFGHHIYKRFLGQEYEKFLLNINSYKHLGWHRRDRDKDID